MTDLTERLRGRIAEASPLPWVYRPDKYDDWGWIRGVEQESDIGRYRPVVAIAKDSNVREETFGLHRQNKTDPYGPNALLITDAVNALPDLLTTLETLTQENARLREALEGYRDAAHRRMGVGLSAGRRQLGDGPCRSQNDGSARHDIPSWASLCLGPYSSDPLDAVAASPSQGWSRTMSQNTHFADFVIRVRVEFRDNGEDDLKDQASDHLADGPWFSVGSLLQDADYELQGGVQTLPQSPARKALGGSDE